MLPQEALMYIRAGHGKATLVGKEHRYTYRFGKIKEPRSVEAASRIYVSLLTGPDNDQDFTQLGFIRDGEGGLFPSPEWSMAPSARALLWYLYMAQNKPENAAKAQFYHEGVCGRCGRTLTVPESIASGFGPECITKI